MTREELMETLCSLRSMIVFCDKKDVKYIRIRLNTFKLTDKWKKGEEYIEDAFFVFDDFVGADEDIVKVLESLHGRKVPMGKDFCSKCIKFEACAKMTLSNAYERVENSGTKLLDSVRKAFNNDELLDKLLKHANEMLAQE